MKFIIEADTDKGFVVVSTLVDVETLREEAAGKMMDSNLADEYTNEVLSGLVCRELRGSVVNLLKAYDKGPPEEKKIVPIGNKNPGMLLDRNGKVIH